jgi:hypothetical protein
MLKEGGVSHKIINFNELVFRSINPDFDQRLAIK